MISAVIGIVILGVALYLIETMIPMAAPIKLVVRVIVVLILVVILLRLAGVLLPGVS